MNYSTIKYNHKPLSEKEKMIKYMNHEITLELDSLLLEELRSYKWDNKNELSLTKV